MKKIGLLILFSILFMTACEKEEKTVARQAVMKEFIDVSSYTEWVYFSFSKGSVVTVTDYQNDMSWDIAFHRGDVRLNGGASGIGKAEAVNTQSTNWDAVLAAPSTGYVKDQKGEITIAFTGTGIKVEEQPFSQVLTTWLTVDTSNPPPVYTLHNWIYVLKAADGNYVKLQIYDNKDEKDEKAGFISFKYLYNADGSTSF